MSGTAGEKLLGRALKRHRRSGVWHYVTGQHAARYDPDMSEPDAPVYELSYVDVSGHAVIVYVALMYMTLQYRPSEPETPAVNAQWQPVGLVRAGHSFVGRVQLPQDFELSERMVEVLDQAALVEAQRG